MTMSKSTSVSTFLFYLCIPIFGNALYFIVCDGNPTESEIANIAFFNIAFICLLLPALTKCKADEKHHSGGQRILSSIYLIITTLIASCFIYNYVSLKTTLIVQTLFLGLFLFCYLGTLSANERSNHAVGK